MSIGMRLKFIKLFGSTILLFMLVLIISEVLSISRISTSLNAAAFIVRLFLLGFYACSAVYSWVAVKNVSRDCLVHSIAILIFPISVLTSRYVCEYVENITVSALSRLIFVFIYLVAYILFYRHAKRISVSFWLNSFIVLMIAFGVFAR
jgi:hypothetical protein